MAKDRTAEPADAAVDPKSGEPAARKPLSKGIWPKEIGGVEGPEPTRYGDWEHKGRCTDF